MRRERSVERARGETFELSVETERFFQKRGVTNALVPRRFSGFAVVQNVFSHCRQHQGVRATLSHEDGHRNSFEDCSEIELALEQSAPHIRFDDDVESQHFLEVILRDWFHDARAQKSTNCRNVGRKIVLTSARRVLQEARAHKRTKRLRANNDASTKLIPAIFS